MSIEIQWQRDCQFKAKTEQGFELAIDADNGQAPCPTELLLTALGSCSTTDVVMGLQEQGVKIEALSNTISYTLTGQEPRLYQSVNLHFKVASKNVTKAQIEQAADKAINQYCHVCLMLKPAIEISYSFEIISH